MRSTPALARFDHDGRDLPRRPTTAGTLEFYERNAATYARSTRTLDMQPELDRFLSGLAPSARVLDAGCGSGRDLLAMRRAGMMATGLDYSPALAELAREHSGCEVVVGDLRAPPFTDGAFDAVWAAACLLHLERPDVLPALRQLHRLLVPGGAFFASVKSGRGHERTRDGRLFTYFETEEWRSLMEDAGFDAVELLNDVQHGRRGQTTGWIQSYATA